MKKSALAEDLANSQPPVKPSDPHPFFGDKSKPCLRCGGSFYGSMGHWRRP